MLRILREGHRIGAALAEAGFRLTAAPCEACNRRGIYRRAATGEWWCQRCTAGRLYPATKRENPGIWAQ